MANNLTLLSQWFEVKNLITILLGFGSIYLILQRFHLRLQMRFLKNISDEIIKINDYCIEFSFKHEQILNFIKNEKELDEKVLVEVKTLRSKIKNHLDYLAAQIDAFPYGNPINFFWYSISGKYIFDKIQIDTDKCLTTYQDAIMKDTILQTEELIDMPIDENSSTELIDQERIDTIVVAGLDIISMLEDHSKKLF